MTEHESIEFVGEYAFRIFTLNGGGDGNAFNLIVLTGLSDQAFNSSKNLIKDHYFAFSHRFNRIILIGHPSEIKSEQSFVFEGEYNSNMVADAIAFDVKISGIINTLLTVNLELTNMYLMGKCAGAGLAMKLCAGFPATYQRLFIAHPASVDGVACLTGLPVKITMVWNRHDTYPYKWGACSNQEPYRYGLQAHTLGIDFDLHVIDGIASLDSRERHEIPKEIFDFM
jgi:hypothetical protein